LCGIDGATAKATISAHARSVLLHAEARKTIKCVLKEVTLVDADALTGKAAHPKPTNKEEESARKKIRLNNP
jgi:hypothetical protein